MQNTLSPKLLKSEQEKKMKNLLLLGDSVRMDYDSLVQEKLKGRMNVFFPEDCGRFAQYTLRMLHDWKAKLSLKEVHVVHWNNGLWDVLHLNACSSVSDGEAESMTFIPENLPTERHFDKDPLTPPEMYRYMLGRVWNRLRQLFPEAEIVFATTTPVIEEQASWAFRSNAEIDQYNSIAREVLIPRGVRINELGKFAAEKCRAFHRDWVHYNDEGSSLLADEIVHFLEDEKLI